MAEGLDCLWVSDDGSRNECAIDWYQDDGQYYLFLPGNMTMNTLCIGFSGVNTIRIDDQEINNGDSISDLSAGEYTIKSGSRRYQLNIMQGSSDIPALYIHTDSGSLASIHKSKDNKESGTLLFVDPDGKVSYDGELSHIKMRGNSSTTFKKKNYQIKLDEGENLMGMGKSRTWILTGNSRDKSLLRNQITYDMAMYAQMAYTPEHISAEVYINHEYMGLYLFSEKIMIDDDRIDIADLESETEDINEQPLEEYEFAGAKKPSVGKYKAYAIAENPEDITGGYLIEFESYSSRYEQEASAYYTSRKNTLAIKSPEYCTVEQMDYISNFMQSFENAIFSTDGVDESSGMHYSDLIDVDSLVDKYLIEEITKNYDGNSSSMFFYKPSDEESGTAFAGPVWDYDSAYGSYAQKHNREVLEPDGFWINNASGKNYWWPALYKQTDFAQRVRERYQEVFKPALEILLGYRDEDTGELLSLSSYAESIRSSAEMNFVRWPALKNPSTVANTGHTFDMNIEYLTAFIEGRYEFLNSAWE